MNLKRAIYRTRKYYGEGTNLILLPITFIGLSRSLYQLIDNIPILNQIFTDYTTFLIIGGIALLPLNTIIGYLWVKSPFYKEGIAVGVENNPYRRKLMPGINKDLYFGQVITQRNLNKLFQKEGTLEPGELTILTHYLEVMEKLDQGLTIDEATNNNEYWENRYKTGGKSGKGDLDSWKWSVILQHTTPRDVIDVGCGDLKFWKKQTCTKYTGIDISPTIVKRNQANKPTWGFLLSRSDTYHTTLKAPIVLCISLLGHILDDNEYLGTLHNLCRYSTKHIFINTWNQSPWPNTDTDNHYQKYRDLLKHQDIFTSYGFQLIEEARNGDNSLYVYKLEAPQ